MSGPIRSAVLCARNITVTTQVAALTCPAGVTLILKDVRWINQAAAAANTAIWISRPGGGQAYLFSGSLAQQVPQGVTGWITMDPGCVLNVISASGALQLWVSGTYLSGTAPAIP